MKNTQPKKYDNVEMLDRSKTDGFISKIINKDTVLVSWFIGNDYDDKGMVVKENREETKEKIKSLALTRRPGEMSI